MSGFPSRPPRDAFGSLRYTDDGIELDPDRTLSARVLQLLAWQVAGLGMTADLAWALVEADGSLLAHGAVWNQPRKDGAGTVFAPPPAPSVAHPSLGVYELAWPTTVPNENGEALAVGFLLGEVTVQGPDRSISTIVVAGPTAIVTVYDLLSGLRVDRKFVLRVR